MTLSQLRIVLKVVLPMKEFDINMVIAWWVDSTAKSPIISIAPK